MARVAYGMAIASSSVSTEIIDWEEFKKLGRTFRVRGVPKTFFNFREPVVGVETERSILERVVKGQ